MNVMSKEGRSRERAITDVKNNDHHGVEATEIARLSARTL